MVTSIETLKSYFNTGDTPTEEQFAQLIDAFFHKGTGFVLIEKNTDGNDTQYLFSNGETVKELLTHWAKNADGSISTDHKLGRGTKTPQALIDFLDSEEWQFLRLGKDESGDVLNVYRHTGYLLDENRFHFDGYNGVAQYGFNMDDNSSFEIFGGFNLSAYVGSKFLIDAGGKVEINTNRSDGLVLNHIGGFSNSVGFFMKRQGLNHFSISQGYLTMNLNSYENILALTSGRHTLITTNQDFRLNATLQNYQKARDHRFDTTTVENAVKIDNNGSLIPRNVTAKERLAMPLPKIGSIVYQTDLKEGIYYYKSTGWTLIS